MIFREAQTSDIPQIQVVRNAVKENTLSNPALVTDKDCEEFLTVRGKGWVCEMDNLVVGFAIADLVKNNIWALFVTPEKEGKGIGKKLHDIMLNWYFSKTATTVWLGTGANTKAVLFYNKRGWKQTGIQPNGEIRFEMTIDEWQKINSI